MEIMIKIRWVITDNIRGVSVEEFDTEWNGIYGYFEMCINNQIIGYVPNRELYPNEEWNEEIIYWIGQLAKGFNYVTKHGGKYEIPLLCMSLRKITIKKENMLKICFVNVQTNKSEWEEEVKCTEFCKEICNNLDKFLLEIKMNNEELLKTNLIKDICDIRKAIVI